MRRLLFLSLLTIAIASVSLLFGCSSTSTGSGPLAAGDTTDATFKTAASIFQGADIYDQEMMYMMLAMSGSITQPPAKVNAKADPLGIAAVVGPTPVYHETSQYWYIGVDTNLVSELDTTDYFFADSLQFLHGNTPVQYPDSSLLTTIKYGARMEMARKNVADTIIVTQRSTVSGAAGAIANRGTVQINAIGTFHGHGENMPGPSDSIPNCSASFNFANAWNGVTVNIAQVMDSGACPTAGSIAHVGTLTVNCVNDQNSLQFAGYWTMRTLFSDTIATVTYESPTTRWTVTRTCGQDQLQSPFVLMPAVRQR